MECLTVDVEQSDIDLGERKNPCSCAFALAAKRKFKTEFVFVGVWTLELYDGRPNKIGSRLLKTYCLSENTRDFIRAFDEGNIVEPQTLDIIII